MIVEDSRVMRMMIRNVLGNENEYFEFEDGDEAVSAYASVHPDYVLMDISMRRMDGITATQRIKDMDNNSQVVIVTDFDNKQFRENAATAGAVAYITKENLFDIQNVLTPR
ncbi:MAG: response regulator transcription factor [Ignavibacteriae bacterium]|nr:response regulator transcription factor [Ignavibacteriota bacterium]